MKVTGGGCGRFGDCGVEKTIVFAKKTPTKVGQFSFGQFKEGPLQLQVYIPLQYQVTDRQTTFPPQTLQLINWIILVADWVKENIYLINGFLKFKFYFWRRKKSRLRETLNLSVCADNSNDTKQNIINYSKDAKLQR